MADSFDCVNSNLLLCEENTNTCFDDLGCNVAADEFGLLSSSSSSLLFQQKNKNQIIHDNRSESLTSLPLQSEERIRTMIQRESEHLPRDDYLRRLRTGDLDLSVRREALDWILKVFSFNLLLYHKWNFFFHLFFQLFTIKSCTFLMQFMFLQLGFFLLDISEFLNRNV